MCTVIKKFIKMKSKRSLRIFQMKSWRKFWMVNIVNLSEVLCTRVGWLICSVIWSFAQQGSMQIYYLAMSLIALLQGPCIALLDIYAGWLVNNQWLWTIGIFLLNFSDTSNFCVKETEKHKSKFIKIFGEAPMNITPDDCDVVPMVISICFLIESEKVSIF